MIRQRARRRTVTVLILALGAGFLAWQRVQATRLGYEVETARNRARVLRGRLMSQGMEWEKAVAPAQVARHARTRLRMEPAGPESVRILEAASSSAASGIRVWARSVELLGAVRQGISSLRRPI
ncbi:MAG: hypothetical protein HY924_15365 [Elusimicrobia bacterium]|nr:hypothetical protein [Elusimicrobiota bacterium]